MSIDLVSSIKFSRRQGLAALGLAGARALEHSSAEAATNVTLLCPRSPNPVPPGYGGYAETEMKSWQDAHGAFINYEAVAWEQIHDKIVAGYNGKAALHDINYTAGWIPELSPNLASFNTKLPSYVIEDMPASSFKAVTWNGVGYGVPMTLSLLTLYCNQQHLSAAGISTPPATWDDLKRVAKELTTKERAGWTINYGGVAGIGGTASYWMAFLQQAGGTLYNKDGSPAFASDAGVQALQFMIDLLPSTDPNALANTSINEATAAFMTGKASMMMNWPFMWNVVNDRSLSNVANAVQTSILPAGPAGSASIDGADAWTISAKSSHQDLAESLINVYVSKTVQIAQAISTGWLPIRLSAFDDDRVKEACPHARVVAQQASHPYSSFLTPDYAGVTSAIGAELIKALSGKESPKSALVAAAESVNAIIATRS